MTMRLNEKFVNNESIVKIINLLPRKGNSLTKRPSLKLFTYFQIVFAPSTITGPSEEDMN